MEKKYTPGPWKMMHGSLTAIESETGRMVADCGGYDDRTEQTDIENKANAKIIASAPCLLEALERLIIAAKPHCVSTSQLNMRVEEAQQSIKKATS